MFHRSFWSVVLLWATLFLSCQGSPAASVVSPAPSGPTVAGPAFDNVRCGLRTKDGSLWFGTTGAGIFRYDGKRFHRITTKHGLINDTVYTLLEGSHGDLWVGTINGVSHYRGGLFENIPIPTNTKVDYMIGPPDPAGATRMVTSLLEDLDGNLWIGTNGGGAYRYRAGSLQNYAQKQGLFDVVQSMLQDSTGAIWFCSWNNGGVARYDGKAFEHFGMEEGLGDVMVFQVMQDRAGDLWFALRDNGVSRYDGRSFTVLNKATGLWSNSITSVAQARDGSFWYTSARNGVCHVQGMDQRTLTKADGLSDNAVWFTVEDTLGEMWFGTRNGGLCRWNGQTFEDFSARLAEAAGQ